MKSKEKSKKHIRITLKNIIIFLASIIIILYMIIFYNYYFTNTEVYAKEVNSEPTNVKISEAEPIVIEEIMQNNTKQQQDEFIVEEAELEYITKYQSNPELPKGVIQVIQEGREGKQQLTKKIVYENGEIINEEYINSKVIKAAVDKVVEVGSGTKKISYNVQVGDSVYITSDRANIMLEPNEQAEKVATLTKGDKLQVLTIQNDWYQISGKGATGFIKAENTTSVNQKNIYEEETENSTSNSKSISKLSFDMKLNKPSGLSLEQFKKILKDSKDTNKVFENNAEYFYYIEKQYNINGVFVAAVGIHESAWGTSKIANNKHNLFGYGAYDSNPYSGAYEFSDYSESIDLIARVFVKYYLNPKGTAIYGGEKATGSYYNGPTLTGVNQKYATDKNWANGVYTHMKYLYNKL